MLAERYKQTRFQSTFYRDLYNKLLNWLIASSIIILLLIGSIIYFVLYEAPRDYYATTLGGQIIPMTPMNQ